MRCLGLIVPLLLLVACERQHPRPNVLLVTLDTTRADRLGAYGFALAKTPNLDRIAREGVRMTDAATVAPITLPSHASIMTGLLPPVTGVRDNGSYALGDDAVTLAERLHDAGYRTQAFVSALVLNRRYNLTQGFDGYDDDLWAEDEPKMFMIRDRPAPKTAAVAVSWLEAWAREEGGKPAAEQRPFFAWVHFFDPHQPYTAPAADLAMAPSAYDAEIAIADRGVGLLLDGLRRLRALDDTLVVVTADHGESLGEHGERTHAVFVYDATIHVPMLWRLPRRLPEGSVYAAPARTVDIVPTVLAALGLPGGEQTQGTNLWPAMRGAATPPRGPQYAESLLSEVGFGMAPLYAVRADGWKWIRAPRPELYDLGSDPHELANLYDREPRRAAKLDRELGVILRESGSRALSPQKGAMDRETLEMLQALGYLAPGGARQAMSGMDPKDGLPLYNQLDDARHLAQIGKWAEATVILRQLLATTPANVSARNVLGLALLKQGDIAGARQEYVRSLVDDPKQSRVYCLLGALALADGDVVAAKGMFGKALAITPGFVEAISNLGLLAALEGDEATAASRYQEALAADPTFPRGWRRLGDLRFERGEYAAALGAYERALAILPTDFQAIVQAGNAARRVGDHSKAGGYFDRAARLRPDSWIPPYNQACLAAVTGDRTAALAHLTRSVERGLANPGLLAADPDLASLHGTSELAALSARVSAVAHLRRDDS